jgi:hypothetical protein
LNRHFCPQFYWLVNLQRYTDAKIKINPIESLAEVTSLKYNVTEDSKLDEILSTDKLHFYLSIDKVLTEDLLGKTVPFNLILNTIKHRYAEIYNEIIQRSIDVCNVLA